MQGSRGSKPFFPLRGIMAQNDWYYAQQGQQKGPVSFDQLGQLARGGQLSPSDLIWREGMPNWQPASQMAGLFDAATQAPTYAVAPAAATVNYASPAPAYARPGAGAAAPIGYYAQQPGAVEYAGFWMRFAAFIIDWIIMVVGGAIVGGCIGGIAGASGTLPGKPGWDVVAAVIRIASTAMGWIYYAAMESSSKQGTLGKIALGIQVTDLNGQRIGFGRATGRYFGMIVSALILCIGFMMAGFTPRK